MSETMTAKQERDLEAEFEFWADESLRMANEAMNAGLVWQVWARDWEF